MMILAFILLSSKVHADVHIVNLDISEKSVNYTGKKCTALAINNQIPAPTLHFKEYDQVTIRVHNHLHEGTTLHWHGILLPWQMDGVDGVSQQAIPPGGVYDYHFTLQQSGTYWYHAHAGLQEQRGLYGAFIVDPLKKPAYKYNKDYVIVLSDWSNTSPAKIFANLKKDGDYYAPSLPLQASLSRFIQDYTHARPDERQLWIADYKMMQQMRMSIYDFSDVAYDAFLLNGQTRHSRWAANVKVGDVVRLRFIGAAASTIFHVKIPGAVMQMVHVDGNDVTPYTVHEFSIAPGETFDALVKITKSEPYIIYAESADTLGAAYGVMLTARKQSADKLLVVPFVTPLPVSRALMGQHVADHSMVMSGMMHGAGDKTYATKYQDLIAQVKTNDLHKPVYETIHMRLNGYMNRYLWFINGVPEYKAKPIRIEPEKRYRIIFTNDSMMHHPMHFHGHWLILRNGHGSFDPLLHTIDVAPGATVVADFDTDASGQWVFHCHHLYHMMSGMARVFQYSTLIEILQGEKKPQDIIRPTRYKNRSVVRVDEQVPIDVALVKHPMMHQMGLFTANYLDISEDPLHNVQNFTFKGLYGTDYNKLMLYTNDAEIEQGSVDNADIDIFYWHLIDQYWAVKAGINYFYRPALVPYWQPGIGIEGLMPYFINTELRSYYYQGSLKLDVELSRDTQITNNFFIRLGVRSILASKTITRAQLGSGLNQMQYIVRPYYRLMSGVSIYAQYNHEQNYGVFNHLQRNEGDSPIQNTLSLGLAVLF